MSSDCRAPLMSQVPAPVRRVTKAVVVAVQGINLGAVDGMGNTPLMDAIRHGHTEVQAALRAAGGHPGQHTGRRQAVSGSRRERPGYPPGSCPADDVAAGPPQLLLWHQL